MFKKPFSFEGRIRRTEYGISYLIYIVIISSLQILIGFTATPIFGLIYIPLIWFLLAQGAKRCHDRDNSGWFQLIPFYFLWMLFAAGDEGANRFGADPKNKDYMAEENILDSKIQ